jgi:uncharacterized protein with HEPN domain
MQPDQRDAAFLWDMLDAAKAVMEFIAGRAYAEYVADRMMRGAVERHVEIIGEAASRVSAALQDAHPEIPWRQIIAQRNVIAHEYGEIQDALLWKVATLYVPDLAKKLEPLVPPTPPEVV